MALTFIITGNDLCGTDTDRMAIIYTETVSEQRHATIFEAYSYTISITISSPVLGKLPME